MYEHEIVFTLSAVMATISVGGIGLTLLAIACGEINA